ncbi:DivIVA domain-containing protein [Micromonospora rhizosphaerae]|uniref:DivIVA domain-containing protein n=1 Tax=Micromonospora rhizosphaerae TaxID=568872 RepID=A0A1C6T8X5_9ACTN|nr:DivIVA domain-containing protein [Micromonospora rhizosphaerae]SCL38266.1 DivIVA domain-containing protein [Micromonospora rhizosphaerae]
MELHRNRSSLPLAILCVVGGVVLLSCSREGRVLPILVALGSIALGAVVLVGVLRPFRFAIGPEGLDVRRSGLRGTYRWDQFDALALEDAPRQDGRPGAPRLLGVPAAGMPPGPKATAQHPVDGRAAIELLDLAQVRETPEELAAALTRFAGDRFTDSRTSLGLDGLELEFTEGLRGYRMDRVNELIRRARAALARDDRSARLAARSEIEQARAAGLPVALRGYNTGQVDAALDRLCAALTDESATDRKTAP